MEELDIATIVQRSVYGIFALVTRTFFIQLITFVVYFLLTVFLTPSVIGVYFVVSAVIAFLSYFSDVGLAAALIQKKEDITDAELTTTFTIQQILVVTVVVIALALSPLFGSFYHLHQSGVYLFQALVVAFFLSSLKTIPSIILERNLRFEKLVIPQVVETIFFSITVLLCALNGQGVMSFTYAVLARGISGLIAIYVISPWRIRIGISNNVARRLLSYGVPFQLNSLLALIKDDLLIAYIGKVLPLEQVGYIGFAQKWGFTPLRLFMDNVIRITFPSYSRMQHDKKALGKAIEKSLFATSFFIFPALTGLIVLSPYFVHLIPKYQKWEPALISLAFFGINAALSSVSTPLINALNAIGKIKQTLFFMVFWTIATWVLTPLFIMWYGFNGFAEASAVIAISVIAVVYVARRFVYFEIFQSIFYPFFSAAAMGAIIYFLSPMIVRNFLTLSLMIIVGIISYAGIILALAHKQMRADIKFLIENLRK